MTLNFSQIVEGWRNKLIPPAHLKELIEATAKQRTDVCEQCEHHSSKHKSVRPDAHCTNCGCTLSAKTRCLSCACPLKKWTEIMTGEQEEQFKTMTNGTEQQESNS